jgi:Transglutaminase-like superfamily
MKIWPIAADGPDLSWPQKVGLAAEILLVYPRVRWLLWRRDLPTAVAEVRRRTSKESSPAQPPSPGFYWRCRRFGRAVNRTLSLLPTDSRCLARSLVLVSMLARRGIASRLVIGTRQGPDFAAHAWVELRGAPLLDPGGPEYQQLTEI